MSRPHDGSARAFQLKRKALFMMAWAVKNQSEKCRVKVDSEGHLKSVDDPTKDVSWFNLFKVGCGDSYSRLDPGERGNMERIITNLRKRKSSSSQTGSTSQERMPFRSLYMMHCPSDPVSLFDEVDDPNPPAHPEFSTGQCFQLIGQEINLPGACVPQGYNEGANPWYYVAMGVVICSPLGCKCLQGHIKISVVDSYADVDGRGCQSPFAGNNDPLLPREQLVPGMVIDWPTPLIGPRFVPRAGRPPSTRLGSQSGRRQGRGGGRRRDTATVSAEEREEEMSELGKDVREKPTKTRRNTPIHDWSGLYADNID
jgi:hypothetical protein